MPDHQARTSLDCAESSLAKAAELLVRFPLDPGRASAELRDASRQLEALRNRSEVGNDTKLRERLAGVARAAARVQHLLEAAAGLWFGHCCHARAGHISYTAAGEVQPAPEQAHLVFKA